MSAETHDTGINGQDRKTSDKPPRRCFIYAIRERTTGRQYIGSSVDVADRWRHHRWRLKANIHHCAYLQNAWNKHGADSFEFLILEGLTSNDPEQRRIAELGWLAKSQYYNSLMPGQGRDHFTADEALRMKISASHRRALLADIERAKQATKRGVAAGALMQTPEGRKRARELMLQRWRDPAKRAILAKGLVTRWADPGARSRQSAAIKASPAKAAKSLASKQAWANPNSGLHSRKQTRWSDPTARERQAEKMRAYHAAKRIPTPQD